MFHYRKTRKLYVQRKNASGCPFCKSVTYARSIEATPYSYVVHNLTYYDLWEARDVTEHLLVIPKRHAVSMAELSQAERLDIINIIAFYEAKGYNVYARGAMSPSKSVPHQHTHLIKTADRPAKAIVYVQRPLLLWKL